LLRKSRRKVLAIFGKEDLTITRKRLQAFTQAFKNSGSDAVLQILHAANRKDAQQKTIDAFSLDPKADGLFCMSDEILAGAMKAVQELNIAVPEKLGIVSVSNGFIPGLFNPEITYVETRGDQLGRASFREMSERLENNGLPREETIGARIVEGKSL
jgi:LacI family transcriptional regulator